MADPVGYVVAGKCDGEDKWYLDSIGMWTDRRQAEADRADAAHSDPGQEFIVCAVVPVEGEGRG